ncbi:TIGR01244 family sulfur transferase [Pseudomarimonas salicorniae]|uniref:TIGR01244 family sulfur transferase n=1 Tax=Pseudomarimonas salicorniae TaxID=2933270 RepID=A0ABT0GNH7_9GAMM|nr:TIGR01244 family sulfur transferase [Lysobacter sp. CAU 1642]MCK7595557.1 TIGR01244 family sulfur transferase [Lysobacter sp. CAU 1642]
MSPRFPQLEEGLSVAAQIALDDLPAIAAAGYRSLICNRPDGEAEEQPDMDAVAEAAAGLGLPLRRVPVVGSAISEDDIAAHRAALAELPRPILAYCRSGNRCSVLWALVRADSMPAEQIIDTARGAGYDLSALRPWLQARAASR